MRKTDYFDFMWILTDKDLSRHLTTKEREAMVILTGAYVSNSYDHALHSKALIRSQDVATTLYAACNLGIIGGDYDRANNDK